MKLPLNQLPAQLERGLAGIYLVAADEPLLVAEASDAIRRRALAQGFEERRTHFVEQGFRWESLAGAGESLSLFASRQIVEIRMNSPRPGDAGGKALRELAESKDPDRLVIVTIQDKLDTAAQKSVWCGTIERHGVVVDIRPVMRPELPRFISARAQQKGIKLSRDAAELLADRVEGNLLAADQELLKLALISDGGPVDAAAVEDAVAGSARFDVFRLSDAIVAGELPRALTVLDGLRTEGVHPTLVLWAIVREIQVYSQLKHAEARGRRIEPLFRQLRVWQSREAVVRRALKRYTDAELAALLTAAVTADRAVKGMERMPAWEAVTALLLDLLVPARRRQAA